MDRRDFGRIVLAGAATLGAGGLAVPVQAAGRRTERVSKAHRKAWAREHFRGFENILVPSFTADLKALDEAGIRLDVRQSIAHGFFSTLCAPAALSLEEMKRFMEIAVDEAAGKITVAFAAHTDTDARMLDLIAHGEKVGCQAFLLDLPRTGDEAALAAYVAKFADSTNMAVCLWLSRQHNYARFHPSGIPFGLLDRVADLPNMVGLKVASIDAAMFHHLYERYGRRMLINCLVPGLMPVLIKSYGLQWSGAWTVEALQSPEKPYAVQFFDLMLRGKDAEGMKIYWEHVAPGFDAMGKRMAPMARGGAHPWEHFKYYQFAVGGNGGRMRTDPEHPELPHVSAEDMAYIRDSFGKIGVPTTQTPDAAFEVGRSAAAARRS